MLRDFTISACSCVIYLFLELGDARPQLVICGLAFSKLLYLLCYFENRNFQPVLSIIELSILFCELGLYIRLGVGGVVIDWWGWVGLGRAASLKLICSFNSWRLFSIGGSTVRFSTAVSSSLLRCVLVAIGTCVGLCLLSKGY